MALDIVFGLVILAFGVSGWRNGFSAQLGRLAVVAVAAVAAKFLAAPTGKFISSGVEWTQAMSVGIAFLSYFGVLAMAGTFALSRMVKTLRETLSDGTGLDTGMGSLLGLATGAVVAYATLSGVQLVTQHVGARKPTFAIQYQASRLGRFVLTHNLADPEPFPHATVLKALVGAPDPKRPSKNPDAIGPIRQNPKALFLAESPEVVQTIARGDWKAVRRDGRLLALVTDAEFLKAADEYMSPKHAVKAEEPTERFQELQAK